MYKKRKKEKKYLLGKKSGEGERDDAQHDDKRATTVTELAEGNSSSLLITCGRWLWMESTAWEERRGKNGGGPRREPRNGLRHHWSAGNEA